MNNNENYIKMDGEEAAFESGAIRYTKTGKGRYDLIPGEVIVDVLSHAWLEFYKEGNMTTSAFDIIQSAYVENHGTARYKDTIINLVNYKYASGIMTTDDNGIESKETTFDDFISGFCDMLAELAIHYENGAEKYGVDNWKKGIPVIGGDRGGSFTDSGLRHLNQFLQGRTDEPHHISCIWNFFGALWTLNQQT